MKRLRLVLATVLVLAAGSTLLPRTALAGGHLGGRAVTVIDGHSRFAVPHRSFVFRDHVIVQPFVPFVVSPFVFRDRFVHQHVIVRPFVPFVPFVVSPFVIASAPPVVVAPPVAYAPPPIAYAPPPITYAPPPPAAAPAPAPSAPTVIQYPHGRYELRGDGVTTPYTWVWIPNPPPPPPEAPPPPPAERPAEPTPPSSRGTDRGPTRSAELFCWTDDRGVTTWTNQLAGVPEEYRGRVKRFRGGVPSSCGEEAPGASRGRVRGSDRPA